MFLMFGPYSNFGPAGNIDPWLYTGYFTHFSYLVHHHGITYYATRLPWIVPGLLAFKVATPLAASLFLNVLIMACSVTALYYIVSWYYGKLPAIISCSLLATNPYFIRAVAWDYPDGPAIVYSLAAIAWFVRPSSNRITNGIMAGAFLALSGYTNLADLPVLVSTLLIPVWIMRRSPRALVREAAYVFIGGSAVTLVLAFICKYLLNTFFFYTPQVDMIRYVTTHHEYLSQMWGTGNAWVPQASRLGPPIFILFLGGAALFRVRQRSDAYISVYLCLLATCGLFAILEFGFHNVGLRVPYHSTYILSPLFASTGLLIGEAAMEGGSSLAFAGAAVIAVALPLWFAQAPKALSPSTFWTGMAVAAAIGAALLLAPKRKVFRVAACWLIAGALFVGPAVDVSVSYVWSSSNLSVFRAMMDMEALIDPALKPARNIKFWYDRNEPETNLFTSVHSLYLYGYYDYSNSLTTAPFQDLNIDTDTTIVHLTRDIGKVPGRTALLASRGIETRTDHEWVVSTEKGPVHVVMQEVTSVSSAH